MKQNPTTANKTKRHIQLQIAGDVYAEFRAFCLDEHTSTRAKTHQLTGRARVTRVHREKHNWD